MAGLAAGGTAVRGCRVGGTTKSIPSWPVGAGVGTGAFEPLVAPDAAGGAWS
jgi:hypothetical protein